MRKCFIALLVSTSLFALPATAQSRKELAAVDIDIQQRLSTLESRMLTGDPAAERLMQRMDSLEAAQRSLTGEVERLTYERDNLQGEVQALASQLQDKQALIDRMQVHLDAVDLVASEQRSVSAPRTYGVDESAGFDTQVFPAEPYLMMGQHFQAFLKRLFFCLLYTSPSPRDRTRSRMPSSA